MRRWLVLLAALLLIILGFYFGVLHVPEAGGAVASVHEWLPARAGRQRPLPGLGAPQLVAIFVIVLILWSLLRQGPRGWFKH